MDIVEINMARELAKHKPDYKAYQDVFACSKESAEANASKWLQEHPQVRQRAIEIVEKEAGLTLKDALQGVKEGLQATYTNKYGKQIDYSTRHEYIKTLLRLHNELKDTNDINIDNRQIYLEIDKAYIEDTNKLLDRFNKMMSEPDTIDGEIVE